MDHFIKEHCSPHHIRECDLTAVVLDDLRRVTHFARQKEKQFAAYINQKNSAEVRKEINSLQRELDVMRKRSAELTTLFKRLYEDNISGKLSDERFQKLSADYEKEEQELKVLASSLRKEVELEESKSADVDRFLSVVERYTDIPELTPCILHEFVEKIIVHAASDPKGKNRTQEIDIYYKGIGVLEMSKVTASMEK